MHEYAPFAATLVAIFAGILLNRNDSRELKGELAAMRTDQKSETSSLRGEIAALRGEVKGDIAGLRAEMVSRFTTVEGDLRRFYEITGELKGRVDSLEKRR